MNRSRISTVERCGLSSGLLNEEQIQQARAAMERSEHGFPGVSTLSHDQLLADKLIELGVLNVWQAKQLSEGKNDFTLGGYRIVDYIGKGGMGEVYKAEHGVLRRVVAIKVLRRRKVTSDDIANFVREARVLACLDHENLVRAFDAGEDPKNKAYYLVTEYVPGTDLRKLVRAKGPLGMAEAASVIAQVARALEHAHGQGMIHRDVKPGNILVTPEGKAKLSDLGLAGPISGNEETDPRFGKMVGTPDYFSPDHIEAPWNPTPAWDIYSLGCTLYYCVTGKVPFPGGNTADKCRSHLQLLPLDPRRLNPHLSGDFVDLIGDMMAKNPAERIGSAREVAERLAPWAQGLRQAGGNASAPELGNQHWTSDPALAGDRSAIHASGLEETQASVPAVPGLAILGRDMSNPTIQATQPVASASEDTRESHGIAQPSPESSSSVLVPFAVLFLFPLTVVASILLIWWISRLLF